MVKLGFTQTIDVSEVILTAYMLREFKWQADTAKTDIDIQLTKDFRHGPAQSTQTAMLLDCND